MTDEIKITRWARLSDHDSFKVEYPYTQQNFLEVERLIEEIRDMPEYATFTTAAQTTPVVSDRTKEDIILALTKDNLNSGIVEFDENKIRLTEYLKDKTAWARYNSIFKEKGYKWVADGKNSRWEL